MTLIAVPIFVHDRSELDDVLAQAQAALDGGASLVEWRLDPIVDHPDAVELATELLRRAPAPSIVTCRLASEGGHASDDEQTRIAFLEAVALADDPPKYIDVELASFERSANLRQKVRLVVDHRDQVRDVDTRLILSTHDFEGRPNDLLQRVEAMVSEPACVVAKIVWRARSLRDNLEAFDLLRDRRQPTIALCLGVFGLMSRVLAPKFGGFLTFAALEEGAESAAGQPTIDDLLTTYRFDAITPFTKVYGVVGWPVAHSRGPAIHNAAFDATGYDGVYLPMPVAPGYEPFKATIGAFLDHPDLGFAGASVTLPHKEEAVRFVREIGGTLDRATAAIGAANTLVVGDGGTVTALNTDAPAFCDALVAVGVELDEKRVAILGAGGVARAAAWACRDAGARVTVFGRTRDRLEALGAALGVDTRPWDDLGLEPFDLYVNATPLGMEGGPDPGASPLPERVELSASVVVFDTVYTPVETPLVIAARRAGATVITGDTMFKRQAALQFRAWTGREMPL